jgi:hypothetical protein
MEIPRFGELFPRGGLFEYSRTFECTFCRDREYLSIRGLFHRRAPGAPVEGFQACAKSAGTLPNPFPQLSPLVPCVQKS